MFILCKDTLLQATCCSQDSIAYIPAKCPGIKQFILDYYLRFGPGSCMEQSLLQNHRVTKVLDLMGSLPHVLLTGVSSSPDLLGISKAQDTSISVGKCCNFPLIWWTCFFPYKGTSLAYFKTHWSWDINSFIISMPEGCSCNKCDREQLSAGIRRAKFTVAKISFQTMYQ